MGEFFFRRGSERGELWLYGERGIVSYLTQHLLLEDPAAVWRKATNGRQTLEVALGGAFDKHIVFAEFNLGTSKGFGSPDGGFLGVRDGGQRAFVFIEGKAVLEKNWSLSPQEVSKRIDGIDLSVLDQPALEKLCDANDFSSSPNG